MANSNTKIDFIAGVELRDWRERHNLTDAQIKHIMTSLGWEHLLSGYQQRRRAPMANLAAGHERKRWMNRKSKSGLPLFLSRCHESAQHALKEKQRCECED